MLSLDLISEKYKLNLFGAILFYLLRKGVELVGGGSVIIRAYPVKF